MVQEAEKAVEILAEKGISASLLNMATIKPLDEDRILEFARKCGAVVTCEEHSVVGGLGSAVSEFLSENFPVPVIKVGMKDSFGTSGKWKELLDRFGLNAENIVKSCYTAIERKKERSIRNLHYYFSC